MKILGNNLINFNNGWNEFIEKEMIKDYFLDLLSFLEDEYEKYQIYPPINNVFRAFELTDKNDTKVVILGQDPYFHDGEADGLAFSTTLSKCPSSLRNILKELNSDLGIKKEDFDLQSWAKQGVLLLNSVLTVRSDHPSSHFNRGWEQFTDNVIKNLNDSNKSIIFILWGANAIKKQNLITNNIHHIITSPHPSPLSSYRGFFGSKPFSKVNNILKSCNEKPIKW